MRSQPICLDITQWKQTPPSVCDTLKLSSIRPTRVSAGTAAQYYVACHHAGGKENGVHNTVVSVRGHTSFLWEWTAKYETVAESCRRKARIFWLKGAVDSLDIMTLVFRSESKEQIWGIMALLSVTTWLNMASLPPYIAVICIVTPQNNSRVWN